MGDSVPQADCRGEERMEMRVSPRLGKKEPVWLSPGGAVIDSQCAFGWLKV